jgi:DNA modification methylase
MLLMPAAFDVLVGDCREVMRGMAEASVDAIVTDPPYHLTQTSRGGSPRQNDPATPFGRTKIWLLHNERCYWTISQKYSCARRLY